MASQDYNVSTAAEHLHKAKTLVENAEYKEAANEFGAAAKLFEDGLVKILCAQANTHSSAEDFDAAKAAALSAIRISPGYAPAWYCKGHALFNKGEYEAAKPAFEKAASLETVRNAKIAFADWATRCDDKMKEEEEAKMETVDISNGTAEVVEPKEADTETQNGVESVPLPKDNTRMEWYQSGSHVNIDIYAKNVVKEQSSIVFNSTKLSVRLVRPDKDDYVLEKELFGEIEVDASTWGASRFKVEIKMKKATGGIAWKALDRSGQVLSAALQASADSSRRKEQQEARQQGWSSLADQELKDYKEDDSPMALFRMLYKDADEDTQRAMMKSYTESGGKVLSTNWDEVKKKKVTYEERD